ncbi:MAG TPA: energy-coupling factor transporter transmembrane protein EcfT [Deltaproteobacteria bacterium]|nr:energy-coupling factor transporter transmembrane protein EcfT [Deltaproteobacteria bacterium]
MYRTGTFIAGQSFIYKLDARLKLAAVVILSIFILWSKPLTVFCIGIGLLGIVLAANITLRTLVQAIKPLLIFIILIFLAHALFSGSNSSFAGFSISGAHEGFIVVLRFLCLIAAAVLLTMTTAPSALIAAVKYFLRPLKYLRLPVDDIAIMIMLALRMMPFLLWQKDKIEKAQSARAYDRHRSSLRRRAQAFLSLVMAVLLGVFRRADDIALAMEARNYTRGERSSAIVLELKPADYRAAFAFVVLLLILMALNYYLS